MEKLRFVPIGQLRESASNPRRSFKGMEELTQSVKDNGVLVPLLVRPVDSHLEIIAGARRYRAALEACRLEVPVIVKQVSDDEALEIQVLENLQREDIHPLDEALGYKALLDRPGHDVAAIAAKVSKSESYVYQRLKLADLAAEIQDAFLQDKITAGHALLIARLQPKDQERAFKECFEKYANQELVKVQSLASWIEWNVHLELKGAAFSRSDDDLVPDAGSCVNCPKRTGFNTLLFSDIQEKDVCTDGACFKKKVQAHINREIAKQEQKGKELLRITKDYSGKKDSYLGYSQYSEIRDKKESCDHAQKAIVVAGKQDKGKVITVCADPACKVHKKNAAENSNRHAQEDYQKREKAREEKAAKETQIRQAVFEEVLTRSKESDWIRDDWNLLAYTMVREVTSFDTLKILGQRRGLIEGKANDYQKVQRVAKQLSDLVPSMEIEELCPFLIELCLISYVHVDRYGDLKRPDLFLHAAERFKVDVKAIETKIAGELRQEKKAKDSKVSQPKAKKGKTKTSQSETEAPKTETKPAKKGTKARTKKTPADSPNLSCDNQCDTCDREDCPVYK